MDARGGVPVERPLVLFDLDGTLLDGRTIHHVARSFGVIDEARSCWRSEDRGPTSVSPEVKRQVAALFEGVSLSELEACAGEVPFREGAHEAVDELRALNAIVGVVTGSYHVAAVRARRALMLDFAVGVELEASGGVLTGGLGASGFGGPCEEWICKRAVLEAFADRYGASVSVAVGDGLNDRCMLEAADVGVAVPAASDEVRASADRVIPLEEVPGVVREVAGSVRVDG